MKFKRPKILSYKDTIRFHGHNGPFLALGYRLGKYLNAKLRPKGIMDLEITVKTRAEKPFTCLIDGLQCSTLATIGKGTMALKHTKGKDIIVVVEKNKRTYRYKITKYAMHMCLTADNLDNAVEKIFNAKSHVLWAMKNK